VRVEGEEEGEAHINYSIEALELHVQMMIPYFQFLDLSISVGWLVTIRSSTGEGREGRGGGDDSLLSHFIFHFLPCGGLLVNQFLRFF
jgi:hypothetical protein